MCSPTSGSIFRAGGTLWLPLLVLSSGGFPRNAGAGTRPGHGAMVCQNLSFGPGGRFTRLVVACAGCAPIGEELLFRGFMFRGFVHAPRDAIPSIVLISLIWSLEHIQYGWYKIAELFVFGVLLGLVRWRTGSTTLTILLHMVYNLVASIEIELVLG
jgi:membrane protease YdiL (CAAX protease family)